MVTQIHRTDGLFSLAITGGGTSAISNLFAVPGASRSILEVSVPYDGIALQKYVAGNKTQSCSNPTARAMAMASYQRAKVLAPGSPVYGLGCTAAIATDRNRRGEDQCHVAVQSASRTKTFDLSLNKSQTRAEQEAHCASLIVDAMADIMGLRMLEENDNTLIKASTAPLAWQQLLAGERLTSSDEKPLCIFPGAFNPLHDGHRGMLKIAKNLVGCDPFLEISIRNVDKPPIDFISMSERLTDEYPVVFTNAPTFIEKSALFPEATFIVGADTVARIDESKYYADTAARDEAMKTMSDRGIRFLVFGRHDDGNFISLTDLHLSDGLKALCDEVPETSFSLDISSSAIRAEQS